MLSLFLLSAFLIAWVYFGYPLLLWLGAFGSRRSFRRGTDLPSLSIIVPAHNEESIISVKLRNLLAADYPRELVEILIGSDGSSDKTEDLVRQFVNDGVGLLSFPQQHGKSAIQNALVTASSGEILIFTDADCLFSQTALREMAAHFSDPRIGLITASPTYRNRNSTVITENESLYLRYEAWLRQQESARGLLAMASGSLCAVRRSLWQPLDPSLGEDFLLPLRVADTGMVNLLDPQIRVSTDLTQDRPSSMLGMKARIITKDFRCLLAHLDLLNPLRRGPLAIGLWSHKLLRWLVPYFLIAVLVSSFFLAAHPFFRAVLAAQIVFYTLALAGLCIRRTALGILAVPMSFCVVNAAALIGTMKCLAGRTSGQWKPERRARSAGGV